MIGKRIQELRNYLKLSQEELGKRINMKKPSISLLENGRPVNDRIIQLLCSEFNVNESWLRNGEGQMFKENDLELLELLGENIDNLTDFDTNLISAYIKLSPKERCIIEKLIKNTFEKGSAINEK